MNNVEKGAELQQNTSVSKPKLTEADKKEFFACLLDLHRRFTKTYRIYNLFEITYRELTTQDMNVVFAALNAREISRDDAMFIASIQSIKVLTKLDTEVDIPLTGINVVLDPSGSASIFEFSPVSEMRLKVEEDGESRTVLPVLFKFLLDTFFVKVQVLYEATYLFHIFDSAVDEMYKEAKTANPF